MNREDRCWLEIDLAALRNNWRIVSEMAAPGCTPVAVVKANCYGLGAERIALELENAGCGMFSTADLREARVLRAAGLRSPILLLGPADPSCAAELMREDIIVPVVDTESGRALSAAALAAGGRVRAHVKADVGLSRLGIPVIGREEAAAREVCEIAALPGLACEGLMTHISGMMDPAMDYFNVEQMERFRLFAEMVKEKGVSLKPHCESSLLYLSHPEYHMAYARLTSALLGIQKGYDALGVREVASLKTRLLQIKRISKGTSVGYWMTYVAPRDMVLGIAGVGYGDGLIRALTKGAKMSVRGRQVDSVGKLSMSFAALDLTDVPEAEVGDEVTVFGPEEGAPSVQDYAALYGGHPCEVVCMLKESIPKVYL